ncbi:hypothetical protein CW751_03320 [Brumimicrobium salinarum]|uniref:VWFD domain-containing protein n=1 Tax=Brumimicrobium salinarum TaxID=2058658 RepID=A0A2I0R4T1_9FLAO|nr:VWD domain-containing protein [Brumimicrobium salinarum]PKR81568.1 hypothetical protein CW751_03320 [Brumimicrobium salinarum]
MRYFTFLFAQLFAFAAMANVQSNPVPFERKDSDHIKEIMTRWDKTKGAYLYESIAAIVMKEQQPERPQSVNQTSFELLQMMDEQRIDRMTRIATTALENEKKSTRNDRYYWEEWKEYVQSSKCDINRNGKSSGDPHLRTYDGERFDFQNAGDYLLTASEDNSFMVQTQQVRSSPSIALNGGVAMNINGDLVTFSSPDEERGQKMIHINNEEIQNEKTDLILPQGGIINYRKGKHLVKWPTGEQMSISTREFTDQNLFDLKLYVPSCRNDYYGLLGNNDGEINDLVVHDEETGEEYTRKNVGDNYENTFGSNRNKPAVLNRKSGDLFFITRVYGGAYQLDSTTSLRRHQMTDIPDSIRYPKEMLTLAELEDEKIEEGLKKARTAGVAEEDLFEAVYDYGHLGLEPIAHKDDYQRPKRSTKYKEPELNKEGTGVKNDGNGNQPRIRIRPSIFIGTGVQVNPPRRNQPRTTNPRPNTRTNPGGTRSTPSSRSGRR